jgi:hypothetical protein
MKSAWLLMLIRTASRAGQRPYLLGGLWFLAGYIHGFIQRDQAVLEPGLVEFTNQFHLKRFLKGVGLQ